MSASFEYGRLQFGFDKSSCDKNVWSFPLPRAWTSLHEKVSIAQLFISFSKPLCVCPCYNFKKVCCFFHLCCAF
jgi:hypothetical protein